MNCVLTKHAICPLQGDTWQLTYDSLTGNEEAVLAQKSTPPVSSTTKNRNPDNDRIRKIPDPLPSSPPHLPHRIWGTSHQFFLNSFWCSYTSDSYYMQKTCRSVLASISSYRPHICRTHQNLSSRLFHPRLHRPEAWRNCTRGSRNNSKTFRTCQALY